MITIANLNALIPSLTKRVLNNPEIADICWDRDEDGWGVCDTSANNYLCYEEDGWMIEISYHCMRDGLYCSGNITELTASHCDFDTNELTEFSDEDLAEMWSALDNALESF